MLASLNSSGPVNQAAYGFHSHSLDKCLLRAQQEQGPWETEGWIRCDGNLRSPVFGGLWETEGYGLDNRQMPRVGWGGEIDFRKCDISYQFPAKFP